MVDDNKLKTARGVVAAQIAEAEQIIKDALGDHDTARGFERLRRWRDQTTDKLTASVHPLEGERFGKRDKRSFRIGDPLGNLRDEEKYYTGYLRALDDELRLKPETVLDVAITRIPVDLADGRIAVPAIPQTRAVFIVHGHDELNLYRLKEVLRERWKLEVIELGPLPGKGRTIIEKFEQEAQSATFAFILMTPDDMIAVEDGPYAQARPNVLFELGWFYGRLGRSRVCILFRKGTRIHSDLDGIERIEFEQDVRESVTKMEEELVAAGLLHR